MLSTERSKLMEHLMCSVCLDTVQSPKLCPGCSKMFCYNCIKQCFATNKRCPLCRHYVKDISKFITCHWIKQLAEDIGSVNALKTCLVHSDEQLSLYCNDCQLVICSNCVLFEHDHENHEISSFKDVCQCYKNKAVEMKNDVDEKLKKLLGIQKLLQGNFQKFTKTRDKCYQQMHTSYSDSLMLLFDDSKKQFSARSEELQQKIDTYNMALFELKEMSKLPISVESLETVKDTLSNLQILQQSDTLQKMEHLVLDVVPLIDKAILENAMKFGPEFTTITMCLHDFSHLSRHDRVVHSSSLKFCNLSFKLEVHTAGLMTDPSAYKQNLSLYVILTQPKSLVSELVFCVEVVIVNQFGNVHANKKTTFLAKFGPKLSKTTAIPDFVLKLDTLVQYGYMKDDIDCLVVRFCMRPLSYQVLSKIQDDYIEELKGNQQEKRNLPDTSSEASSLNTNIFTKAIHAVSKLQFANLQFTNHLVP